MGAAAQGIPYPKVADMLYRVVSADRGVYTRMVVQRLTIDDKVLTAAEHFQDAAALPLPAQMFRFGAETVMDNTEEFPYYDDRLGVVAHFPQHFAALEPARDLPIRERRRFLELVREHGVGLQDRRRMLRPF
ncbi:MAG: hypothetical protein OXM59_11990 [Gammaproteobacteria bacterium]|nr:hypothetical protein [Gammaproteobacteria bacterium]